MNHTIYSNSKHKTIQKLKNKNILHWGFTVKGQGEELSPGNPSDITIRSEANRLKVVVFIWESCFWCHLEEKRDKYGSARMKQEHFWEQQQVYSRWCTYFQVVLILCSKWWIHSNFRWCKGRHLNKLQIRVANQLPCEPQEGLLKVIITLGRDVIILRKREYIDLALHLQSITAWHSAFTNALIFHKHITK